MGLKITLNFIETSPELGIIAGWGPLTISMVIRSDGRFKLEMLCLARTSS